MFFLASLLAFFGNSFIFLDRLQALHQAREEDREEIDSILACAGIIDGGHEEEMGN